MKANILPSSIAGTATLGPYRIAAWEKEHPILNAFNDPQFGDLHSLRFQKLAMIDLPKDKEGSQQKFNILASTADGKPVLIESEIGSSAQSEQEKESPIGKVLIWTSTADIEWTKWPQGRLFVPIVRQMLAYLTDHHLRLRQTENVTAKEKPGIKRDGDRIRVANVDPLESELARVSPEEFRISLGLPETKKFSDLTSTELAALAPPAGSLRPEEIWKTIAWILLGWLLVETFLAGRVHA